MEKQIKKGLWMSRANLADERDNVFWGWSVVKEKVKE